MNKQYGCYLIDLDGTIYRGEKTIQSGVDFVNRLNEKKIPYLFLTNNTTRTPEMIVAKLASHGVITDVDHVYTPIMATVSYLLEHNPGTDAIPVYIIGQIGLWKGLLAEDRIVLDNNNPKYVIVGMDTDLTYKKICIATNAIRKGAEFIGTNSDHVLPSGDKLLPGNGSQCAMIAVASDQKTFFIGKPSAVIVNYALKKIKKNIEESLIVGDNYETDIMAGINCRMDSLLTLTGVTTKKQLAEEKIQPTYVLNNLDEWQL